MLVFDLSNHLHPSGMLTIPVPHVWRVVSLHGAYEHLDASYFRVYVRTDSSKNSLVVYVKVE